jgi:predicted TIM-barrel fold metal-dependent hydrolase
MAKGRLTQRLAAALMLSACTAPALAGSGAGQASPAPASSLSRPGQPQVAVDHHMHVHSPAILAFLPGYCSSPGRIGACPVEFTKAYSPEELIAQMDRAGIDRGLVMSTAYLAESPMMVPQAPDHAKILRDANAWSVQLARRFPGRFGIFIGINPLTDTALPEIAHWSNDPDVTGIKLHLTNSGVDLRNPEQVRRLAAVFRAAAKAHLAIMIHMRTRAPDYGARDVATFLHDVLPAAGTTPVQIAHAGGWGGVDAQTLSALGAFAAGISADPALGRHLTFDLAAVWKRDTPAPDLQKLASLIRRIGPRHFVPASDFPFSGDLAAYYAQDYPALPLTKAEWRRIRTNRPDYARAGFAAKRMESTTSARPAP